MTNKSFKNYVTEFKKSLEEVKTVKDVKALANLYNETELDSVGLTDKQLETLIALFDAKTAELSAGTLKAPAEQSDEDEFVEVDDRKELTPHKPEIMDDEAFNKFYDSVVGEFAHCESVEEVNEANDFFNSEIAAGVLVLTNEQLIKCANVIMERRNELAHPKKATKKGKVTSKMSKKKEAPADVQPAQTPEQPETAPAPVEVFKGEVIETKNEAEINAAIGRISTVIDTIGRGYLEIVGDVARLRKFEAWKLTGHKNLYELCADKFGMSKGTVHNLEVVFKKYGDPETFQLTDACAGMSLREMLQNIDAEKKAIAGEVAGEAADGDGNGGEATDSKKTKAQTLIDVSYELAGDDWNVDAILDEIRKQLEQNPEAKEAFPDGASVKFTITI